MDLKISVITVSLNAEKYIEDAIKSVLDQHYKRFEHIIIDACSTDQTLSIVKKYPHIKLVSEPDNGQSDAMNKGFRISDGDIIVYLNADDYFLPGAFDRVIRYFNQGAGFVIGKIKVLSDDGTFWINDPKFTYDEMIRHWEPQAFAVNPVGYFYQREIQEKTGGFNIHNHYTMDLEFLLEASLITPFTKVKEETLLGIFRRTQSSKTLIHEIKNSVMWTNTYWPFIDRFVATMSPEKRKQYNRARKSGYLSRQIDQLYKAIKGTGLKEDLSLVKKAGLSFRVLFLYTQKILLDIN